MEIVTRLISFFLSMLVLVHSIQYLVIQKFEMSIDSFCPFRHKNKHISLMFVMCTRSFMIVWFITSSGLLV